MMLYGKRLLQQPVTDSGDFRPHLKYETSESQRGPDRQNHISRGAELKRISADADVIN